jgi:hypothetical protein
MPEFDWKYESAWEKIARQDPMELWKRAIGSSPPRDGIRLGTGVANDEELYIPASELSTHMHVVGATGVGKSFFLEGILKRLIEQGHGLCLMTPHEDIYQRLIDYCATVHRAKPELGLARRVIPFDLSNTQHIFGFNPVARNARVMTYQVVALIDAIRKCWGQGSLQETPRLARWLYNTGYAVVESNLTMLQALHLVDTKTTPLRRAITARIRNPEIRAEWEWIQAQKAREQGELLESSFNRIREFVSHERIRLIIGQHTKTIDFPSVLREGKILLVNLSRAGVMSESNQELIGTLLVNELLTAAFARPRGARRPFFVCLDEFQHFASKDICEILDGGRKFGLHLILAHQLLNQLKAKEPEVYYSTLTNARAKVVFGGMIDEDLDILGRELFTGELDPDQVKDEIWRTAYDPVEATRLIVSDSESEGSSESYSEVSHTSLGQVFIPDSEYGHLPQIPQSVAEGESSGRAEGGSRSAQHSRSETRVPWYEYHERQELSSRTFRSLEEQLYIKKAQLKRQPRQHAAILRPDAKVEFVKTPTLREFDIPESVRTDFLAECYESAGCFKSPIEAEREVAALEKSLLLPPGPIVIDTRAVPDDDDSEFFDALPSKKNG